MKELSELDSVREVGEVIPDLNFSSLLHRSLQDPNEKNQS